MRLSVARAWSQTASDLAQSQSASGKTARAALGLLVEALPDALP